MGGLDVIDPRFAAIHDRACEVLGTDDRVVGVEIAGSVGSGTADEWSDLDLYVITTKDGHEGIVAEWPDWLAKITPTVFARTPIAPFVINTVTDTGLTFDISVWPEAPPVFNPQSRYVVGTLANTPFERIEDALEYAVNEQLRGMAGPLISLIHRDEHVKHLTGVPHLLGLLTTVFLAETGAAPPGKHWNRSFTEEQRDAIAALPPVSATREGLLAFGMALAEMLFTRARPQFARYGLEWPSEFANVVAGRVHDELGIDVSSWCR